MKNKRESESAGGVGSRKLLGRAWDILKARGPMRGSDLGWELWGETTDCPTRGTGSQQHNKFCRPAGKVLKRLQRLGCVREIPEKTHMAWAAMGNRPNTLVSDGGAAASQERRVSRRRANHIVRATGLNVKRAKVDADEYSMTHKGSRLVDLHGVDTITAAEIIQAANAEPSHAANKKKETP
jgi:hypothetical protein